MAIAQASTLPQLLWCLDSGAGSLDLEGSETKHLGSLSREKDTDRAILKGTQPFTLWQWLLSAVRERCPFKEYLMFNSDKWTIMEKDIQYVRELAVVEMIHGINLDDNTHSQDPDDVICMCATRRAVQNAPYHLPAPWQEWTGKVTKDQWWMKWLFWQYEESTSSSLQACISAVEKLSQEIQQFKDKMSCSPPVQTSISDTPLEREDIVGTQYVPSCGFTYMTMESLWGSGIENPPWPYWHQYVSCKGKQSQERVLPGK